MTRIRKIALVCYILLTIVGCYAAVPHTPRINFPTPKPDITQAPSVGGSSECTLDQFLDMMAARQLATGNLQVLSPPTLKATFLAVQALGLLNFAGDLNTAAVAAYVRACYDPQSQVFRDDVTNAFDGGMRVSGYSDIEATYYALATLALLGQLNPADWTNVANAILARYDSSTGGFWCRAGVETVHDAYFACKALGLLNAVETLKSLDIANFVAAHQLSNPSEWWQVGGFYNIQNDTLMDADFDSPNIISAYYGVATLFDRNQASAFDATNLEYFINLYRNATAGTFSLGNGYNIAENVASAYVLALQPYLPNDGQINYAAAASALINRLNARDYRESYLAPINHMLVAAYTMVWGVNASGRLNELTFATNASLRSFISSFYVASGTQGGYAPDNDAGLTDIAAIATAASDANKLNQFAVNTLYAYVNRTYTKLGPYFFNFGNSILHCNLPSWTGPSSLDGPLQAGIPATYAGLKALYGIGKLNDFLGKIGGAGAILPNVTNAQFLNASAGACNGGFLLSENWVRFWQLYPAERSLIFPQWTLQALFTIALLDPTAPQTHFNATAAWDYLSQFYVDSSINAWFVPPTYLRASAAEWTARLATALLKVDMDSYFNLSKFVTWLAAHVNKNSLPEVAAYLDLQSQGGAAVPNLPLIAQSFNTLEDTLADGSHAWYHAQGGTWPDRSTVADLDMLRNDRHIYITNYQSPSTATAGTSVSVGLSAATLFNASLAGLTATYAIGASSASLIQQPTGQYTGWLALTSDNSLVGTQVYTFSASKLGWCPVQVSGSIQIAARDAPGGSNSNSSSSKNSTNNSTGDANNDTANSDPAASALSFTFLGTTGAGGIVLASAGMATRRRRPRGKETQ